MSKYWQHMNHGGHTEDAFLQAIFAQPYSNGLRMVFSYWLDEQGEHDRAKFIRIQCYPTRLRKEQVTLMEELLSKHREEWLGSLAQLRQPPRFTEGLPDLSRLSDLNDLEYQIVSTSPYLLLTENLMIGTTTSENAVSDKSTQILAASPYLEHITGLTLNQTYISPVGLQNLIEAPSMDRLDYLALDGRGAEGSEYTCGVPEFVTPFFDLNHVKAVANSPSATRLTMLTLRYNRLEDTAAEALLASPYLTRLRCLQMHVNVMSLDAVIALRKRFGVCVVGRHG